MKKIHIITIVFLVTVLISSTVTFALTVSPCVNTWDTYRQVSDTIGTTKGLGYIYNEGIRYTMVLLFSAFGIVCSLALLVLQSPRFFRKSTWVNLSEEWAQNKAERTAAKKAKAEADKQKEIDELQAKLDELKKDE